MHVGPRIRPPCIQADGSSRLPRHARGSGCPEIPILLGSLALFHRSPPAAGPFSGCTSRPVRLRLRTAIRRTVASTFVAQGRPSGGGVRASATGRPSGNEASGVGGSKPQPPGSPCGALGDDAQISTSTNSAMILSSPSSRASKTSGSNAGSSESGLSRTTACRHPPSSLAILSESYTFTV